MMIKNIKHKNMDISYIDLSKYKEYIVKLLNTSYRTVDVIYGNGSSLSVVYSISNKRVIREDARLKANFARILKVLSPVPLITGIDNLKENAECLFSINVIDIHNNQIRFEYNISVCNGSKVDKWRIKNSELSKISNIISHIGYKVSESEFYVDVNKWTM